MNGVGLSIDRYAVQAMLFGPVLTPVIEAASSSKPFVIHPPHPSIAAPCAYAIGPKIPIQEEGEKGVRIALHKRCVFLQCTDIHKLECF